MMFDRSMYENVTEDELLEKATERKAKYAVLVKVASKPDPANAWNMYGFSGVTIYDMADETQKYIYVENGEIVEEEGKRE